MTPYMWLWMRLSEPLQNDVREIALATDSIVFLTIGYKGAVMAHFLPRNSITKGTA